MSRRVLGVALLAVAALAVRLALVAHTPGYVPRHDDRDYVRVAWSMAQGKGYPAGTLHLPGGRQRLVAQAWRPPLWPAVLAVPLRAAGATGTLPARVPGLTAARVVDALLGVLAVLLTAAFARRLWGVRAGWWAGALGAFYLPLALLSTVLFSETLFVCLELGALLVALDGRSAQRAAAAGFLAGLAWLTRSNGVLLLPAVWLLVASGGRGRVRVARLVAVSAAFAVVVAPWTIRNAVHLHAFVPVSTETGGTLAGTYNAASAGFRANPGAWFLLRDTPYRHAVARATPPAVADRRLRSLALHFALHHPAYVGTVVVWNLRRLFGLAGRGRLLFEAGEADIGPRSATAAIVSAWAVAALALAAVAAGLARSAPAALWLAPGLLLLSELLTIAESGRFRAPIEPFLLGLAGAGLARVTGRRPSRVTT